MFRYLSSFAVILALSACSRDPAYVPDPAAETRAVEASPASSSTPLGNAPPDAAMTLQARFDCIREHGALIAAHRGGVRRDFPENALETLEESYRRGLRIFELDVAQSRDGALFLMHDDTLDRTTTGKGAVRDTDWKDIESLALTSYDRPTPYAPPLLADALDWAVASNSILELDRKRSANLEAPVGAIEARGASNHVAIITYSLEEARDVARLAPDLMLTASVESLADIASLERAGVRRSNLIAWTGTQELKPDLWRDLSDLGVEVAFGTLGRRGDRFDDIFWKDRNGEEYEQLVRDGVTLIATDFSDRVSAALTSDDDAIRQCGL